VKTTGETVFPGLGLKPKVETGVPGEQFITVMVLVSALEQPNGSVTVRIT
jgi:hypothetical protein